MALKLTTTMIDNFGIACNLKDCYVRIENFMGSKNLIAIEVATYSSDKSKVFCTKNYEFVPDMNVDMNIIAQGYSYLKTLPAFVDAKDC